MRHRRLLVLFTLLASGAFAQWLNFPTPGTPRTRDGKPNLTAPAPRALDGKPDLSGVWRHEITPPAELRRLFDTAIDSAGQVEVPGMEAAGNHKYSRNILVDFKAEESPLRPEAAEIMRQRAASTNPAEVCAVGQFGIPLAGLLAELIKIVQAPRMSVIFYEIDNLHRQIPISRSRISLAGARARARSAKPFSPCPKARCRSGRNGSPRTTSTA